jgi:hypothetical protein
VAGAGARHQPLAGGARRARRCTAPGSGRAKTLFALARTELPLADYVAGTDSEQADGDIGHLIALEFLAEIREHSSQFREWWEEHELIETQRGTKVLQHPRLGTLRLHHAQTVPTGSAGVCGWPSTRRRTSSPATL